MIPNECLASGMVVLWIEYHKIAQFNLNYD